MTVNELFAPAQGLPAVLPIFPLDEVLLLPHGHLPLQIFEPRYLNMVEEALGNGRLIGMVQPKLPQSHPIPDHAEVFAIGCAGRIISFSETEDRRYLITLHGLCRFRIASKLALRKGFRRVRPDFRPFLGDLAHPEPVRIDRDRLLKATRTYFELKNISCDWASVENAGDQALVISFSMMCPFETREKQALLECSGPAERSALLVSLFEMAVREADRRAPGAWH